MNTALFRSSPTLLHASRMLAMHSMLSLLSASPRGPFTMPISGIPCTHPAIEVWHMLTSRTGEVIRLFTAIHVTRPSTPHDTAVTAQPSTLTDLTVLPVNV